jgi:hypothetical protein
VERDVDLARGAHPKLHARAPQPRALDPLLDDPALGVERAEVLLHPDLGVLELHRRPDVAVDRVEVNERVPQTAHPAIELEHRAARLGATPADLRERALEIRLAVDLEPYGMRDALLGEHASAPGLGAERRQPRVAAVRGDPEPDGQLDLRLGHRKRHDERKLRLADQGADPLDRPGSPQELLREGLVPPVDERDGGEAPPRLGRVELGDEAEVVVEDPRVNWLRGHVDDPRARRAQQAQHEAEKALLVGGEDRH